MTIDGQIPMNKLQAMARIMMLLNHEGLLKPGTHVYRQVRKMVGDMIDRLGPDAALNQVAANQTRLLDQIRFLGLWHRTTRKKPPPGC